jgi:autotransporter-associated beta strand protein
MKIHSIRFILVSAGLLACAVNPLPAALRTWDGGGANNNWSNRTNWVSDIAPVAGDDLEFPTGAARPANNNDFPAGTTFNSLIFSGGTYALGGNALALSSGILATNGSNHAIANALTLNSSQSFVMNFGNSSFNFMGEIRTGGHLLTFQVTSPALTYANGPVVGSGGLIKTGTGSVYLGVSNAFSGDVIVQAGFLNVTDSGALGTAAGSTTVSNGASLLLLNDITVSEPLFLGGTLRAVGSPNKVWSGPITLVANNPAMTVDINAGLTINAAISGPSGFSKNSTGTLTLNSNNNFTGQITLNDGLLVVNGNQSANPVQFNKGTLGGLGSVGAITTASNGAKGLRPGNSVGIFTTGSVALDPLTSLQVELNGPGAGTGYDQLRVNGTVILTNSTLSATLSFAPTVGTTFILVDNDGNDPVIGNFSGLAEGAVINLAGQRFQLSYVGGSGNDITLTRISLPPTGIVTLTALGGGHKFLQATGGIPGYTYAVEGAGNLLPAVTWSNLAGVLPNGSGIISFTDTNAGLFPARYYRIRSP